MRDAAHVRNDHEQTGNLLQVAGTDEMLNDSDNPKITIDDRSQLFLLRLVREEHASELNPAMVAILDKALGKTGIS